MKILMLHLKMSYQLMSQFPCRTLLTIAFQRSTFWLILTHKSKEMNKFLRMIPPYMKSLKMAKMISKLSQSQKNPQNLSN